jgi:hypothetical protein
MKNACLFARGGCLDTLEALGCERERIDDVRRT